MISCICAVVALIIFMIILSISFKYEIENEIAIIVFGCLSMIAFIVSASCCLIGNTDKLDELKFVELAIIADHFDELPNYQKVLCANEIHDWNDSVNDYNNLWFKFVVEDRNKYIIIIKEN